MYVPLGETAAGSYPVDAVETMVSICDQAESDIDYRLLFQKLRMNVKPPVSVVDSICSSSVKVINRNKHTCFNECFIQIV